MIKVCIAGISGRVGYALAQEILRADDLKLMAGVSRRHQKLDLDKLMLKPDAQLSLFGSVKEALKIGVDVLVDYTDAAIVKANVISALEENVNVVIGTSGLTDQDYDEIDRLAKKQNVGVFAAANFAITAVLMQRFAELAARYVPSWEIIDYGKADKSDAPSGTARELAFRLSQIGKPLIKRQLNETIGDVAARGATLGGTQIHSLRLSGFLSSAEVIFGSPGERLSIRHDSTDWADPYVNGTLLAIRKVVGLKGLVRGLDKLINI